MESGYRRIILGTWTASINPTRYFLPKALKKMAKTVTLTMTVTQQWLVAQSDKVITMEWDCLDKADVDSIQTMFETSSTYSFTDVYNGTWTVAIEDFEATRITTLDADGFRATLNLQVISKDS